MRKVFIIMIRFSVPCPLSGWFFLAWDDVGKDFDPQKKDRIVRQSLIILEKGSSFSPDLIRDLLKIRGSGIFAVLFCFCISAAFFVSVRIAGRR